MQRAQRAGEPAKSTRQDEGGELGARDVIAARRGTRLVLAHRFEYRAERRGENARKQPQRARNERQHHVILVDRVDKIDIDAQYIDARDVDAAQSVLAAGYAFPLV